MTLNFKAKHGWHMMISAYNCGAKGSSVFLTATKAGSHYSFSHGYNGPLRKSGCSGTKTLNSGKLHAYWGKLFHLKMSVVGAGAKTSVAVPKGCTGTPGHQRAIKAHGTLNMTIHKRVLGHIRLTHLKGVMELFPMITNCSGTHFPKETFADGTFGTRNLFASKNDHTGSTSVTVSNYGVKLGSGVFEGFGDTFTGAPFTFSKDLTSAKVGSITGFMSGSLSFTGTKCSPGWVNGAWKSGTLKVHDGISKVKLVGSVTATGAVFKSNASPC